MTDSRRRSSVNTGQMSLTTEISPASTGQPLNGSTSSAVAFRAKTSVSLVSVPGWMGTLRDYGLNSPVVFVKYDPTTFSWKTPQHSLFGDLETFSGTWPHSGTMQNGIAYRRQPSVPTTFELERGFLPTPLASETGWRRTPYAQGGLALSTVIGGPANPLYVEWMMGFPIGWTDLQPSETQSYLKSQNISDDV